MLLHTLLHHFDDSLILDAAGNPEITGVAEDSRLVKPGDLFIARGGTKTDGRQFIADAAARGALAAVVQHDDSGAKASAPIPLIPVRDIASAGSMLANLFYELPARRVQVLGITGTNGKTTTSYLIRHILASVRRRCGLIGTVEIDDGRSVREATLTTPSAVELAQLLATMRNRGCWSCAIEVSSHALDQQRVAGVEFAGAAFTNLTGDHLDYHGTMDHYADAKAKLFESLSDDAVAAVNDDDPWSARMVRDCHARVMRWGFGKAADYRAKDVSVTAEGASFVLVTPDGEAEVKMGLTGKHNIANALTAATLVGEIFQLSVWQIAAALRDAQGAPGRLQPVRAGQPFSVLVDYAHTDDALENVLSALRPIAQGQLRVIFGCGGDRDRTKRPRMAKVAARYADAIYVTSDNPRTENPASIIDEIVAGFPQNASKKVTVEADRRVAIEKAIGEAGPGDVVLLAGKGHENYQIVGTQKRHFDDVEEAQRALQSKLSA